MTDVMTNKYFPLVVYEQSHHKKMHRRDAFARSRWQRY